MEALPPTCLAECALQSAVGGLTARSEWRQPALPLSTPRPPPELLSTSWGISRTSRELEKPFLKAQDKERIQDLL